MFSIHDLNGNTLYTFGRMSSPNTPTVVAISPDSLLLCYGDMFGGTNYVFCNSRASIDDNMVILSTVASWPSRKSVNFDGKMVISEDKSTIALYLDDDDLSIRLITLTQNPSDGRYSGTTSDPEYSLQIDLNV